MRLLSEAARTADIRGIADIGVDAYAGDWRRHGSRLRDTIWFQVHKSGTAALGCAERSRLSEIEVLTTRNRKNCAKNQEVIKRFAVREELFAI